MALIKRLIPGPEKTITTLITALQNYDINKIKKCFTGKALTYVEKQIQDKRGHLGIWASRDYFKDMVWQIDNKRKLEDGRISCFISAAGGKNERWEFSKELIFTRVGWNWKISEIPELTE